MGNRLRDCYKLFCLQHIQTTLSSAAGKAPQVVQDEAQYRQLIIEPGWMGLPLPVRQLGREALRWDEFMLSMRQGAYQNNQGKVGIRSDLEKNIHILIDHMFPAPAESKPQEVPMAAPVQKAEPKPEVTEPVVDENGAIIGIDLGTTYSVVAYVDNNGRPCTIHNSAGDLTTPSVILLDDDGPVVGKEALMAAAMEPERVASCVKRDMGARTFRKKLGDEHFPPEVLSSMILKSLKEDAERKLGTVSKAVITVPAYFDEARRRATMDAGQLAGLKVLGIINEPTAAAISYGYESGFLNKSAEAGKPVDVLVYDLGGGTFDVTIVHIEGPSFTAVATDGDVTLGGKDWDEKIVEIVAERVKATGADDPQLDPSTMEELWQAAETAKKTLTERTKATIYLNHAGKRHKVELTRDEFEEATASLLGRTQTTTEIVVRQAGLKWSAIDRVLVVGGSTRMPMIQKMLEQMTGKPPEQSVSPDEAVAHGAALFAELLDKKNRSEKGDFTVTNVCSHSLGLVGINPETKRRKNQILIPKNTKLPHTMLGTFKTSKPNQTNILLRIVEGESERPEACMQIGTCKVAPLPEKLPAGWPVYVKYSYLEDGQLRVSAQVKGQQKAVTTVFQRDNNMGENEIAMWKIYLNPGDE